MELKKILRLPLRWHFADGERQMDGICSVCVCVIIVTASVVDPYPYFGKWM
jgi:hypothetical protein